MSGGGETRVSIPHNVRKVIHEIKKTTGPKHSDEFIYTTLKDCDMDPEETGRRLKMVQDIIEIAGMHNVDDVYTMLKECNLDPNEAAQRLLYLDTFHEVKKKHDRRKSASKFQSGRNSSSGKEYGVTNRQERVSRPTIPLQSGRETNVAHVTKSAVTGNGGTVAISNGSYSHKLAASPSSTSDTVVASKITQQTCAIGTIQCEIVKRSGSTKSNARIPVPDGIMVSADSIPVIADSDNSRQLKADVVEKIDISESLKPLPLSTQEVVSPNQDNKSLYEPLKVTASEKTAKFITDTHSIPEDLKICGQKREEKSSHVAVIFPDNLQVPEYFKNHLTFGTLNATHHDAQAPTITESVEQVDESVPDPTLKDGNIPSDPCPKHEETKVEMMSPIGGFQNPILQRDYGFGFMPHLMHFNNVPDLQQSGGSVVTTGLGQSQTPTGTQAPLSPPVFPYFRQPYPNYFPYNPYFPHLYLPHLMNHGMFPHQPLPPTQFKPPNQDVEEKDNNNNNHLEPSPQQQGEEDEQQVWGHAIGGREVAPNYIYNFPPPNVLPFSPFQPLVYQSPPTSGTLEKPQINLETNHVTE